VEYFEKLAANEIEVQYNASACGKEGR
jgi:hypothetical protein